MIPSELQIGDTWYWPATVADFPATEWTLKYAFRGLALSVIDITATADGTDYEITVIAATTAAYLKGTYNWVAYVEKGTGDATERYTVGQGTVTLLPYLGAATGATDNRTHARKMLDSIETALESAAPKAAIVSLTVNGKSVQYKRDDLLKMRAQYRREVAKEVGQDNLVRIQFGSA